MKTMTRLFGIPNDQQPSFLNIHKLRFILGITLGLIFSAVFYAWVYMLREIVRLLSVSFNHDLWILSNREMWFYNLFYAFIALILGQSLCFTVWLEKPAPFLDRYGYKIKAIVNDQRNLNWYFISWFSKMAFFYALFAGTVFPAFHYVFSFYPSYIYLFILIISVLFLQTWTNARLVLRKYSLKWMFASALIISVLSLGLSKVDFVDYNSINLNYLKHDVYYKFDLQLPESDYCERLFSPNIENIYVVKSSSTKAQIIINNKSVLFGDLEESIRSLMEVYGDFALSEVIWRLHIDKEIRMEVVDSVKQALSNCGIRRVAYAVLPYIREFDKRYYRDCSLTPVITSVIPSGSSITNLERNFTNIIQLQGNGYGQCLFNNQPLSCDSIKKYIKWQILKDTNYIIELKVNVPGPFEDYARLYFPVRSAIAELRNDEARKLFGKTMEELYDIKKIERIKEKFKIRMIELNDPIPIQTLK
jgi:hypothetical protein